MFFFLFYLTCGPGCLEVITSGSHKESSLCCRMYQAQVAFGSDVQIWKQVSWHYWSQIFVVVEKRISSAPDLCSVIKSNLTVSSHSWTTKPADTLLIWAGLAECHWNVTNSTNKLSIHYSVSLILSGPEGKIDRLTLLKVKVVQPVWVCCCLQNLITCVTKISGRVEGTQS